MAELNTGDILAASLFHHASNSNIKPETSPGGGGT